MSTKSSLYLIPFKSYVHFSESAHQLIRMIQNKKMQIYSIYFEKNDVKGLSTIMTSVIPLDVFMDF